MGIGHRVWGQRQEAAGLITEAIASFERARDLFERLVRDHPNVADYQWRLGGAYQDIARAQCSLGHSEDALRGDLKVLALTERLVSEHPEIQEYQSDLIYNLGAVGWDQYRLFGRNEEALASYLKAHKLAEARVRENPGLNSALVALAYAEHEIGRVLVRLGRSEEALSYYLKVLKFRENSMRGGEGGIWNQMDLGYLDYEIGKIHRAAGRMAEASESLARALTRLEAVAASDAVDPYSRACANAVCAGFAGQEKPALSEEDQARRKKFAEQAVATLRKAASGGHQSVAMIESAPDFEAIRSNDDFRALVAELKGGGPGKDPSTSAHP